MLPIQERPLLRIGEGILVLDEQYLIERATQGHQAGILTDTQRQ